MRQRANALVRPDAEKENIAHQLHIVLSYAAVSHARAAIWSHSKLFGVLGRPTRHRVNFESHFSHPVPCACIQGHATALACTSRDCLVGSHILCENGTKRSLFLQPQQGFSAATINMSLNRSKAAR